jgi:hypothetical protein
VFQAADKEDAPIPYSRPAQTPLKPSDYERTDVDNSDTAPYGALAAAPKSENEQNIKRLESIVVERNPNAKPEEEQHQSPFGGLPQGQPQGLPQGLPQYPPGFPGVGSPFQPQGSPGSIPTLGGIGGQFPGGLPGTGGHGTSVGFPPGDGRPAGIFSPGQFPTAGSPPFNPFQQPGQFPFHGNAPNGHYVPQYAAQNFYNYGGYGPSPYYYGDRPAYYVIVPAMNK